MERTIPQRELRNSVSAVLREVEAGQTFTVTVRGRPVAKLGPLAERRVDVDRETIRRIIEMPIEGEDLAAELDAMEAPLDPLADDPWGDS